MYAAEVLTVDDTGKVDVAYDVDNSVGISLSQSTDWPNCERKKRNRRKRRGLEEVERGRRRQRCAWWVGAPTQSTLQMKDIPKKAFIYIYIYI